MARWQHALFVVVPTPHSRVRKPIPQARCQQVREPSNSSTVTDAAAIGHANGIWTPKPRFSESREITGIHRAAVQIDSELPNCQGKSLFLTLSVAQGRQPKTQRIQADKP